MSVRVCTTVFVLMRVCKHALVSVCAVHYVREYASVCKYSIHAMFRHV